jgi:hypothetical protein
MSTTITTSSTTTPGPYNTTSPSPASNNTPAIVGGVVGGVAVLVICALGVFFMMRRKKRNTSGSQPEVQTMQQQPSPLGITPSGGEVDHPTYKPGYPSPGQQQEMYSGSPDKAVVWTTTSHPPAAPSYSCPVSPLTETGRLSMVQPASPPTGHDPSSVQFSQHRGSSFADPGGVPPTVLEADGEAVDAAMAPGETTHTTMASSTRWVDLCCVVVVPGG